MCTLQLHVNDVNIIAMSALTSGRPYHHGDLRRALIDASTELAAAQGPDGVVLREAARRIGVSPSAAYRHFPNREGLLAVVGSRARQTLAALQRIAQTTQIAGTAPPESETGKGAGHVAGALQHFVDALAPGRADAVLAASLFHYGELRIADLKHYLAEHNIPVRQIP